MMFLKIANKLGEWAEGYKQDIYIDTVGKQTFGIGWNIDDRGCPYPIAQFAHEYFLAEAAKYLEDNESYFSALDDVRKAALTDMVYNMGYTCFRGFKKMRKALSRGMYTEAAKQAKDSRWYRQVGRRGPVIVKMIETGQWDEARINAG